MRGKCKKIQPILFFVSAVFILLSLMGALVSCDDGFDGNADTVLRSGDDRVVAKVYPTGGKISPDAKDLTNGYVGLMSTVISDERQITEYLSGQPTILEFVGVTSIECVFTDPVFQNVTKIIFDKDIKNVCSRAFECADDTLTQVIFKGDVGANIGRYAFGAEDDRLLIIVPNESYVEDSSHRDDSDMRSGNYWYWQHENMQTQSSVFPIYILPSLGAIIDEDNSLQMYYRKLQPAAPQELEIGTLPEYPWQGTGVPEEWSVLTVEQTADHGVNETVEGAYVEIIRDEDDKPIKHIIHLPDYVAEPLKVCVSKWLPTTAFTTIVVEGNWPKVSHNITWTDLSGVEHAFPDEEPSTQKGYPGFEHHGEILVEVGTARSYFEKTPTIPRDSVHRQLAFWDSVWTTADESGLMVFNGKTGDHWDLVPSVPGYTNDLGYWTVSDTNIKLYAHWVNAFTKNGVWYNYQMDDTDVYYADWANQDADNGNIVVTPTQLEDIGTRIDWRPGYKFVMWSRTKDGSAGPFDVVNEGPYLTTATDVYAIWEPLNTKVTFYGNEDKNSISKMKKGGVVCDSVNSSEPGLTVERVTNAVYNESLGDKMFIPTRDGYKFEYWYSIDPYAEDPEGKIIIYDTNEVLNSSNALVHYNNGQPFVNLYAMWTPNKTTITFHNILPKAYKDSDANAQDQDITFEFEFEGQSYASIVGEITTPTGNSYVLMGGYLDDDEAINENTCVIKAKNPGEEPRTDNTEILNRFLKLENVVNKTTGYNTTYTQINSLLVDAGNNNGVIWTYCADGDNELELYGMYIEGKTFRVKYYSHWYSTDTNQVVTQEVVRGQKAYEVTSRTNGTANIYGTTFTEYNPLWWRGDGYHFFGWYTTSTTFSNYKTGVTSMSGAGVQLKASDYKYDFDTPVTGDIDLYAHWTPKKYTITLDSNKGAITGVSGLEIRSRFEITAGELPVSARTTELNAYYDGIVDFDKYPMEWYMNCSDSKVSVVYLGWNEEEFRNSVIATYPATTETDAKNYPAFFRSDAGMIKGNVWLVRSVPAPSFQERIDWSASSSWAVDDERWTNGTSAGDISLYAAWRAMSNSAVVLADKTVDLELYTESSGSSVTNKRNGTSIKSLHLQFTMDNKTGFDVLKSDSASSTNKTTHEYLSSANSVFEYKDASGKKNYELAGFFSKPQGEGGKLVLNPDGSYNTSGLTKGHNNGYVFMDDNGALYWLAGGTTLYAHWNQI